MAAEFPKPRTPADVQAHIAQQLESRLQADAAWDEANRDAIVQSVKDVIAAFNAVDWTKADQRDRSIVRRSDNTIRFIEATLDAQVDVGFRKVQSDSWILDKTTLLFRLLHAAFKTGGWELFSVLRTHDGKLSITCDAQ